VVIEEYPHVMSWLRSRMDVGAPVRALYGRGQQVDMWSYMRFCTRTVEGAGGFVVPETEVSHILMEDGAVAGAITTHADGDTELRAPRILLATGGFQADHDLRAQYIHPAARGMRLRSNPNSTGGGLRLGLAAGSAVAGPNSGYYGHLLARGCPMRGDSDFVRYTQYHSIHGVLLNRRGQRLAEGERYGHGKRRHDIEADFAPHDATQDFYEKRR